MYILPDHEQLCSIVFRFYTIRRAEMDYILQKRRRLIYTASAALILVFVTQLSTKWLIAIQATMGTTNSENEFKYNTVENTEYRPCIIQLWGDEILRKWEAISAAGGRLSVTMARDFARKQNMAYHLYDCMGLGTCGKAPAIRDACYVQQCTHVLYIDADVLLHDTDTDVVRHLTEVYPDAVFMMGIDYYRTMKTARWHNGKDRLYRTDSNSGMVQFACNKPLSKRILAEWERLCRRFSPYGSDQEAATLMETLPQYQHSGTFVRDGLMLGQYSIVARHFPGGGDKIEDYPLPTYPDYKQRVAGIKTGLFKWVHAYWKTVHGTELPPTEIWRLDDKSKEAGWNWTGPAFKKCPLNQGNYVADLLSSLDLDHEHHPSLDQIKENGYGYIGDKDDGFTGDQSPQ